MDMLIWRWLDVEQIELVYQDQERVRLAEPDVLLSMEALIHSLDLVALSVTDLNPAGETLSDLADSAAAGPFAPSSLE